MKLLLSSAGFTTAEIVGKCEELVGKPREEINFGIINEAYAVEPEDHSWVLTDLNQIRENFGGRMELINLLALDIDTVSERIEQNDVMYVVGGQTDYLKSVFDKTGFTKLLPKLLDTKVYVGSSAGAMVMGQRLSAAAYRQIYGERDTYGASSYLEFVYFALMPHLNSPLFPNRKETLLKATKSHKGLVYGLDDDTAIVVEGEQTYTIGNEPIKIIDGK